MIMLYAQYAGEKYDVQLLRNEIPVRLCRMPVEDARTLLRGTGGVAAELVRDYPDERQVTIFEASSLCQPGHFRLILRIAHVPTFYRHGLSAQAAGRSGSVQDDTNESPFSTPLPTD